MFFCKRRKPKNVFCATEVLSTPCACSPYFTILNSGTRGVEGIRWWGASLLGIINSGAGANPVTGGHRWAHTDTWHQTSTITLLLLLFYYSSSTTTTSVFVFTLLLTYNGSTTRRDLEPFLLELAVVLQELLIISQLWYDLLRSSLYLYVYVL